MKLQELGKTLKDMYNSAETGLKVATIHMFGIKYGKDIEEGQYRASDLIRESELQESYITELSKGLNLYKCLRDNTFDISFNDIKINNESQDTVEEITNNNESRVKNAFNLLIYGVPGSGKSYYIQKKYCNDDKYMERVVFHPGYTYSDFVGQILPSVNEFGKIDYKFTPGPFTTILRKAETDRDHMYYLIVEELNRGNAPSIFGDLFQLLDRDDNGSSEYSITNFDMAAIIYKGQYEKKVKLPSNLSIIATMNTSDQSIFALDTAFKRRWSMKLIENKIKSAYFSNIKMLGTDITWYEFASAINSVILEANAEMISTEDKRLGAYFIKESDLSYDTENNCSFAEKVLMYLWNDVFKYNREDVFSTNYLTLEDLIKGFELTNFKVFSEYVIEKMRLIKAENSNER